MVETEQGEGAATRTLDWEWFANLSLVTEASAVGAAAVDLEVDLAGKVVRAATDFGLIFVGMATPLRARMACSANKVMTMVEVEGVWVETAAVPWDWVEMRPHRIGRITPWVEAVAAEMEATACPVGEARSPSRRSTFTTVKAVLAAEVADMAAES
jgi:hypothetical protein